ncbi:YjfB family protein [Thiomicrorhabdus sp. ZW0627]|uniref:YjfB family protein n=1 Tax=Thiomicrorhabdus sp. ZW0627 TaxID=3039774 RepID=UPI002436F723|nr:YjfB family protein [Thiomicrorhabdus sp. ZW0627]MDG6774012.1 YjfB family protein [Thiomicrorhabdus sp. ZW0627]
MEISANSAVTSAYYQQQANTQEQVQVSMLKKAIDTQAANALTLIASLPTPPANAGLPSNLGNNINTTA